MEAVQGPHPLAWKKRGPLLPVRRPLPDLDKGQSLCAQYGMFATVQRSITLYIPLSNNGYTVPSSASEFRFFVFPSPPVQHALSTLMLRLPREIRAMIYAHLTGMFKAYSGAFVTADLQPKQGDVYMFDTGAWYSIPHFRGEPIGPDTVLELDAAPWAHQNLAHLFNRTPARHLRALHPQLLEECVDDICLRTGSVRLSMQYRNHVNAHRYDKALFDAFARHARALTLTVAYSGVCIGGAKATTLGYDSGSESDERLAVIDDLHAIFSAAGGCKAQTLTLQLTFDVPFTASCRLTVNERWVQREVQRLAVFGCDIQLAIYNRCDDRFPMAGDAYECPMWEHIFSYQSSFGRDRGWSPWTKREISMYEAAALECR